MYAANVDQKCTSYAASRGSLPLKRHDRTNEVGAHSRWFFAPRLLTLAVLATTASPAAAQPEPDQSISPTPDQTLPSPFENAFEPFGEPSSKIAITPGAVDLSTIEPPLGPQVIRSLGTGVASYYGKRFHGRLTANGERFNMRAMTAAHKTLPFGTHVRVTNPATDRSVIVRINDRGPFIRGRTIDLSRSAAERIGMIQRGHARVRLEIVAP